MKITEINKALQIKELLDSGNIDSKEANRRMNNQFIILGGRNFKNDKLGKKHKIG